MLFLIFNCLIISCDDCKKVSELYEELDWFKDDEEERKEIESKIESMGYFI